MVLSQLAQCCISAGQYKLAAQSYEKGLLTCKSTRDDRCNTLDSRCGNPVAWFLCEGAISHVDELRRLLQCLGGQKGNVLVVAKQNKGFVS